MNSDDLYDLELLEQDYFPVLKKKSNLISSYLEGKKIIDIGCGNGNLLNFLKNKNLELFGTDYSKNYLIKARKKIPRCEFFQADLLNEKFWKNHSNQYDSIICSEVLEHLDDDLTALKNIHIILRKNGVLIITVPALMSLYSEFDKKIGHYRRYSINKISKTLQIAGFKIEKIHYWNFFGMFGWFILFKILKLNIKKTSSPILGKILGNLLSLESKINFPIGQTIIIKARKL